MFDIVGKRRWYFLISACVIGLGIAAMIYSTVRFGTPVRLSVDFAGGSRFLLKFEGPATEDAIRRVFAKHGFSNPIVNRLEDSQGNVLWQVRTKAIRPEEAEVIIDELAEKVAPLDRGQSTLDSVSPAIGEEVTRAATLAVATASVVILGFIVVAFRRVPKAFRYGTCAIASLIHDILVALSFFSIMGILRGWEVDALFLTAILTVIGFSVQDTIVVFDRIRENIPKRRGEPFEMIVNRSILETIHRSLATQLNAMFVMIAILLFGGGTVKQFVATMLVGMLSGTYSSIFTAVPLLVVWEKGEIGQILQRLRGRRATA